MQRRSEEVEDLGAPPPLKKRLRQAARYNDHEADRWAKRRLTDLYVDCYDDTDI